MGARIPKLRFPQGLALWAPLAGLLLLGTATTIMDWLQEPSAEQTRANADKQRAIIDPATGVIALGSAAESGTFDVAEETKPEAAHAEAKPAAEVAPAEDHPSEEATHTEETKPEEKPAETAAVTEAKPEEPKTEAPVVAEAKPEEAHPAPEPATSTAEPSAEPAPAATAEASDAAEKLPTGLAVLRTEPLKVETPAVARSHESLVSAPAPEVTELVAQQPMPKRSEKGTSVSSLYAHPFKRAEDQHLLVFVITDAGLDAQSLPMILTLPKEVSIAFSPYARKVRSQIEMARAAGYEAWAMLPVMSDHYPQDDPGPLGLIASMPEEEMMRRLHEIMTNLIGTVGFVLEPDENLSSRRNSFASVLIEINKRGMLLASTHPTHSIEQMTSDKELKKIIRRTDLILDPVPNEAQIESKLAGLADVAALKDHYVVVLSARPQTLRILTNWLKKNPIQAPLSLAPLSAVYAEPLVEGPPAAESSGGHGAAKPEAKKESGGHGGGAKKEAKKPEKKSGGHH